MNPIAITLVIPNYNGADETIDLLTSISKANYPQSKLEVILIDDASTDNSPYKIKEQFKKIKIIQLKKNKGPAYARNEGIKASSNDYILSCDNDVIFPKEYFSNLNKISRKYPNCIIGSKILEKNTKKLISEGYFYNKWTAIESGFDKFTASREVDFVPAAAMFFPKKTGKFDSEFKFFAEDADFCLSAKEKGIKVIYDPKLIIEHGKKRVILDPNRKYYLYYFGKFKLILKHSNFLQIIISLIFQLFVVPLWRYLIKGFTLENITLKNKKDYLYLRWKAFFDVIKKESVF